jgi:predicted dehydrogenase
MDMSLIAMNEKPLKTSRRSFLAQTMAGGAILSMTPRSYRAVFADQPPSERVRIGMIGVGNQGGPKNNMKYFLKNIVALCDLDPNYLGEANAFLNRETNATAFATDDYRRLLDSKDIDAVVVTVPDHWHALMTIDACKAGKDVYCEKPLSLVIQEGRAMTDAARKYGRVVQTGSMQRSGDEFKLAIELIQKGIVGPVRSVRVTLPGPNWIARAGGPVSDGPPPAGFDFDRWLGPAPLRAYNKNRVHYLFRFFWDYSGGQQTNFGAHHLDIAQWGLGMDDSGPVSVEGSATFHPQGWYETPDTAEIRYRYSNGVTLVCQQVTDNPSRDKGTEFLGDKGSLFVSRGVIRANPSELLKGIELPKIPGSQANHAHVKDFLDCIKTRSRPAADVSIGHRSATVCHLGNIAVRLKRKIEWDPATETIVNDSEASRWLSKEYRKPWSLTP